MIAQNPIGNLLLTRITYTQYKFISISRKCHLFKSISYYFITNILHVFGKFLGQGHYSNNADSKDNICIPVHEVDLESCGRSLVEGAVALWCNPAELWCQKLSVVRVRAQPRQSHGQGHNQFCFVFVLAIARLKLSPFKDFCLPMRF